MAEEPATTEEDADEEEETSTSTTAAPPSSSGGGLVWYADLARGYCRDDGDRPGNFAQFGACCKRAFPDGRRECRDASVANSATLEPSPGGETTTTSAPDVSVCAGLRPRQCVADARCALDRSDPTDDKRCVERAAAPDLGGGGTVPEVEEEDEQPAADVVPCPILNRKKCNKEAHCGWSKGLAKCGYIVGDDAPATTTTTTTTSTTTSTTTTTTTPAPEKPTLPGYTHPYYPDLVRGICLQDGNHGSVPDPSSLPLYGDLDECCRHPVLETKYCKKNSDGPFPPPSEKEDAGYEVVDAVVEETADGVVHKFYPDYLAGLCKNDGKQISWESDLFDDLEGCCRLKYLRYDECMSRSVE